VKHAQRKRPLLAGHLVVVQLHGVDLAAAEFIVLSVGPEYRRQQNSSVRTFRMLLHWRLKVLNSDYTTGGGRARPKNAVATDEHAQTRINADERLGFMGLQSVSIRAETVFLGPAYSL